VPAIAILALAGYESLFAEIYRFFTTASLVTFGGAYAVLAWVNQQAVEVYGWLTQAETVAGLALAETTPGPLIIVLQFVGFMAGWNQPGTLTPATAATTAALLASWAIFLPSFIFILVGAPYGDKLASNARLSTALACMTAAVVGVVGSLAIAFGRNVLFPAGLAAPEWNAIAIAAVAFGLLQWTKVDAIWIIAGGAAAGLALGFV
jgi:chromate transporter